MKKQVIIIVSIVLAVVLLLVGGVAAAGVAIYNNLPSVVALNSVTGAVTDLMERDEIAPILSTVQKGSVSLNATLDSSKMSEDIKIGELKGSVGGKIYFSDKALFVENLNAKIENPKENYTFDVNAEMYLSDEYGYVSNDKYLGGTYGIYKKGLAESFKRSFLADELSDSEREQIISILEAYESEDTDDFTKEGQKFIEDYAKTLKKSIAKNAEFTSETKEIYVGGELVKSRIVNVTIDGDAIYATVADLYEEIKKDKALRKYVIKYNDRFEDMGLFNGEVDEAGAAEFYDELLFDFSDELNDMRRELVGSKGALIISIATPSLSSTLRKLTVSVESGSGNIDDIFELDLGKDGIAKTNKVTVTIDKDDIYCYEINENSSDAYDAVLTYTGVVKSYESYSPSEDTYEEFVTKEKKKTVVLAAISINKNNDTFKLAIDDGDMSIGGNWSTESKATTIVIKEYTDDSVEIKDGVEITLVIDQKDSMPKPKKEKEVKNVFELTENDFENIATKFEDAFTSSSADSAK